MLSKIFKSKGTLTGVLFFCSLEVAAQNAQDLQWQKMLLYRPTLFGVESEADNKDFFVHKNGRTDPKKELNSFIGSIDPEVKDELKNIYCRFPARIRWLKKYKSIPENKIECVELEKYRKRLAGKSISVVFSSYFLGNPASTFGHTFIRIGKHSTLDSTKTELLDTGINYGALTEGADPVTFAIGGLAGWFYGGYNAIPYYYKVREYNDYETRDLWSYQLDMTQEEIDFMVDYIWELGHTRFDYFFLTENCSYHMLSILEAARPTLKLHDRLPRLYTIPSETLKVLEAEGLVSKITFRSAPSTHFYHQLNMLNNDERKEVQKLVFDKKKDKVFSNDREALVYDTAISLVDYKFAKQILKGDEEAQSLKRPLLIARSKIPVSSPELDFSYKFLKAPHKGHGQKRIGVTYGNVEGKNILDAEWRFAFHDILDNDIGYPPKTKLEVMKFQVRSDGNDYQLRDWSIVDVMTLGKWDIYNKASSWKVKLGEWQTRYEKKDLSTYGAQGGYGYSYELGPFTPYLLAHIENSYVTESLHKYKFAYGGDLGLLTDISESWKLLNLFEGRVYPWKESRLLNEIRFSNQRLGVGIYQQSFLVDGKQEFGLRFFKYL